MDYHSIHGYDRASFDAPGTHRLPTVSASQALDELDNDASTHISTGIEDLDRSLIANITADSQDTTKGGVQRGQVTEIWGPPGAGKTALGLQLTANALCDGDAVVWFAISIGQLRLAKIPRWQSYTQEQQGSKSICKANTSITFDLVVLSQCATKMHSERGATLTAAVNASVWEQGISTRLVMFRDWTWQENNLTSVFLAGLQKLDGKACQEVVENVVAFKVELDGVSQVPYEALKTFELARHKRKLGQTELEVPDSEDDEDYGWADEDEAAMPAPPPQWQGSEDLILGQDIGQSEDENSEQEEPVTDDESIMK
ncbi:DNA repair rhp55 [Fusarium pseudoanthophilum]|uniref:DNA repair rhp55 n=1 Tax=Fusarium pseudoanthophilum TaxID=48495 RepID=A0A8H5V5E0_9HYPO|nr:DNA repair rhp55 [Fusarium pseudoanthophilum]